MLEDEPEKFSPIADIDQNEYGDETPDIKPDSFAEHFWENLGTKGAVPVEQLKKMAMERPISATDLQYLQTRYMFLDICNGDLSAPPEDDVKATTIIAQSGWIIYDRGDRLTTGPGRLAYGPYLLKNQNQPAVKDVDGEDGGTESGGSGGDKWLFGDGTLTKQLFDTVIEMMDIAASRWGLAVILDGYYAMQRAAWMAAQEINFSIDYSPNSEDQQLYETIRSRTSIFNKISKKTPTPRA
jgi:hypothetical protein